MSGSPAAAAAAPAQSAGEGLDAAAGTEGEGAAPGGSNGEGGPGGRRVSEPEEEVAGGSKRHKTGGVMLGGVAQ